MFKGELSNFQGLKLKRIQVREVYTLELFLSVSELLNICVHC